MGQCHVNHGRVVVLELSWAGLDSNGKDAEDIVLVNPNTCGGWVDPHSHIYLLRDPQP